MCHSKARGAFQLCGFSSFVRMSLEVHLPNFGDHQIPLLAMGVSVSASMRTWSPVPRYTRVKILGMSTAPPLYIYVYYVKGEGKVLNLF